MHNLQINLTKIAPSLRYKNPNETITSLNFSPTDNAISFTTLNGKFITWNDPVPADHPHPARTNDKRSLGNRGAADDKTATDALFDDEGEGEDLADLDDDWIIDDEGGEGGARYGEREKSLGVGAKEVGEWTLMTYLALSARRLLRLFTIYGSERLPGTSTFSTRRDIDEGQETLSRFVSVLGCYSQQAQLTSGPPQPST
jgi:hypothetical protein